MIDFTPMIESVKKQKTRDILISKISDYQSGYNKTVSAYNDNFGGWDGSNYDADYKNRYKTVSDTLSQTSNNARSIIKLLELNKQYFDDEYDEIYNSLVGSSENISSMQENSAKFTMLRLHIFAVMVTPEDGSVINPVQVADLLLTLVFILSTCLCI